MLPVGRKELFGFVERHAGRRLKEYSDLSDGSVLCALFSKVFPKCKVPVVTKETHSSSQMAHHNWSALASRFRKLGIPLTLIDRRGIEDNEASKGFSAIVLLYFLYNVTRQKDFTAEFVIDVPQELTDFLQSVESVRALVLGGALGLSDVPEQLRAQISELSPSSSSPTGEGSGTLLRADHAVTPEAAGGSRIAAVSRLDEPVGMEEEEQWSDEEEAVEEQPLLEQVRRDEGDDTLDFSSDEDLWEGGPSATETPRGPMPHAHSPSANAGVKFHQGTQLRPTMSADASGGAMSLAVDNDAMESMLFVDTLRSEILAMREERERDRRRLADKDAEIRQLQQNAVSLFEQTAKLRSERRSWKSCDDQPPAATRVEELEEQLAEAHRAIAAMKGSTRGAVDSATSPLPQLGSSDALESVDQKATGRGEEVIELPTTVVKRCCLQSPAGDEGSGEEEEIDVHDEIHAIHQLLIDHVPRSKLRDALQRRLWDVLSSYHILESRIVSASMTIQRLLRERREYESSDVKRNQKEQSMHHVDKDNQLHAQLVAALRQEVAEGEVDADLLRHHCARIQREHEEMLLDLHRRSSKEMAPVLEHVDQLQERVLALTEREATWKALCQALRRSEELSRALLDNNNDRRSALLTEREDCEVTALRLVQVLSSSNTLFPSADLFSVQADLNASDGRAEEEEPQHQSPLRGVTRAMEHLVAATGRSRDEMQKQLAATQRELSATRLRAADLGDELAIASARLGALERLRVADAKQLHDLRMQIEVNRAERLSLDATLQQAYESACVWSVAPPEDSSLPHKDSVNTRTASRSSEEAKHSPSHARRSDLRSSVETTAATRSSLPQPPAFRLSYPSPSGGGTFRSPPTEQKFVAHRAVSASPLQNQQGLGGGAAKPFDDLLAQGFFAASPASSPPPRSVAA